jgi:hypothetical protein
MKAIRTVVRAALVAAAALIHAPAGAQPVVRLPAQDRILPMRAQNAFQIGAEDGQSWEVLSGVRQVAFDRNENLYVLDGGNARVLVFDRAGRFVRQIGKRGGGPGELLAPMRMALLGDGTLVVSDNGRRSFSVFGADGRFTRSVPHDTAFGLSGEWMAAHPRGGVVTSTQPINLPGAAPRGKTLLWYSLAARAPTRLVQLAPEAAPTSNQQARGRTTVVSSWKQVFSPSLQWDLLPGGGVVMANTAGYSLRVTGPNGAVQRVIERPIRPRPVTQRDRDAELARRRDGGGVTVVGGSGTVPPAVRQAIAAQMANVEFAPVIPVIDRMIVDRAGRVWVQRSGPADGRPGPVDILAADGRYVGTLAPQAAPNAFSPAGRAAYITRDEMGVERVVVRTLPRIGA